MNRSHMKRFSFLLFLNLLIITLPISGQTKSELREIFVEAESYFLFDEYTEALPLYLKILKTYPDNANLKYRAGVCYLNIPGEKDKSIKYLEEATKIINLKYREGSFREVAAPLEAYYYLGDAYRVNNKLNKAIETYQYFKENIDDKNYDESIVDYQIQTCRNAIKLEKTPLFLSFVNLGGTINTRFSDYNPVVSGNEDRMVYTQKLQFYDAVFYSKKVEGKWTTPINLTPEFSIDQDFYSTSISFDGNTLYLYKNDEYDGNIYVSHLVNERWTTVEKLNANINTKYWESHACESQDGKTLYFTSNRKGGLGGLDIYKSERDSSGSWGTAINLGPTINTEFNEETPFITPVGTTLYFSSRGHFSMGGYDIFYSSLYDNGEWSAPLNMGYPINTPDDDKFYVPVGEGYFSYYSLFAESGYGNMDVFRLEIFSNEHPRKFRVSGVVNLSQTPVGFKEQIQVYVTDSENNDTVNSLKVSDSGVYNFVVPSGEYDLNFVSDGFEPASEHLSLPMGSEDTIINVPTTTLNLIDISANLQLMDSVINVKSDTIEIDLEVEPGSILIVEVFEDSTLISTEEFYMTDSLYTYKYVSEPGEKTIKFTLTDKFGNTTSNELTLSIPVPVYFAIDEFAEETEDEVIEEDPVVDSTLIVRSAEVKAFKEALSEHAEGNLKKTLENLDTEKEEIYSTYELIAFLIENAAFLGYTEEELAVLLARIAANGNPDEEEFKNNFTPYTEEGLHIALSEMDNLKKQKIKNIKDFIHKLLEIKVEYNYSSADLMNSLIDMIATQDIDIAEVKDLISDTEKDGLGTGTKIFILMLGLAGIFFIFLLYRRRKKRDEE